MQEVVQAIGAAAGWAAAVGLVLLSALHLSQARDVKRLREWAGRASGRSGPAVTAPPSGAPASPTRPRPATLPRRSHPGYSRIGIRYVALALVGLVVLGGAAAYGVSQLTGDDGADNSGSAQTNNDADSADKPKRSAAAVKPGNVTVAVLNGTTVPGLAAMLGDQIAAAGFEKGTIDVFSDQQLAESVVQYAPGHEPAAEAVSRKLGISRRAPVTATSRALAGDATVIVIAGADKAP